MAKNWVKIVVVVTIVGLFIGAVGGWGLAVYIKTTSTDELAALQGEYDTLLDEKDTLFEHHTGLELDYTNAKTTINRRDNSIEDLNGQMTDLESEINIMQSTMANLQSEIDDLTQDNDDLSADLNNLEETLRCPYYSSFFPDYTSNQTMSDALAAWIEDNYGEVMYSDWVVWWNDAESTMHYVETYDVAYMFFVSYKDSVNGTQETVYLLNTMCYVDYVW